jgi:hypothetical protein
MYKEVVLANDKHFFYIFKLTFDLLWPWPLFCMRELNSTWEIFKLYSHIYIYSNTHKWMFYLLFDIWFLSRHLIHSNYSYEEHLTQVILKSLHACGSLSPDTGFALTKSMTLSFERRTCVLCVTNQSWWIFVPIIL